MRPMPSVNPADLAAESDAVSCILRAPELIKQLDDFTTADITSADLRTIYGTMLELAEDGIEIQPATIFDRLQPDPKAVGLFGGEQGLKTTLIELWDDLKNPIPLYASKAVQKIKEQRLRYELWRQGSKLHDAMGDPTADLGEIVGNLREWVVKVADDHRYPTRIAERVRSWVMGSTGTFFSTDVYADLGIKDPQTKKAAVAALTRMVEQGLIEKTGLRRGCYRLIEQTMELMDFRGTTPPPLDIHWPFELEKWVKILPKNIVVVAGAPDAGKTAVLMNVIKMNQQRYRTWYFNSEMGPTELQSRLKLFDDMRLDEWAFTAVARATNFSDVIQPDDLNIIDYLEVTDQMWMVGDELNRIHRKLRNGCAIVALQKDDTAVLGRGRSFSLEKPRLYLTIDKPGILRIIKAKNWRITSQNPNDMAIDFKLVQGSKLIPTTTWYKDKSSYERQQKSNARKR